jgi:rod shape-determining protein MreB and related proteins
MTPMLLTFLLAKFFPNAFYVRVRRNEFRIRHVGSGTETTVRADVPFSSARMLIGEFSAAEHTLKLAMKQAQTGRLLRMPTQIVMHPLEMVEGGLSQIEDRVFREVAISAGASKAEVWVGPELSDAEVKEKLSGK